MKYFKLFLLATFFLHITPIHAGNTGDGAAASTRDASILSMMGWGVGLAAGIALLCGYLKQDTSHSH